MGEERAGGRDARRRRCALHRPCPPPARRSPPPPPPQAINPDKGKQCAPADALPRFYPTKGYEPQLAIGGKVAVVTGASRGIGRSVATALVERGLTVLGTSRYPGNTTGLPYPLLPLDLADPVSVDAFVDAITSHPAVVARGGLDILIQNAGRFALGGPYPQVAVARGLLEGLGRVGMEAGDGLGSARVGRGRGEARVQGPAPPDPPTQPTPPPLPRQAGASDVWNDGLRLAMATNVEGPARLCTGLLPSLRDAAKRHGYARLLLTLSPAGLLMSGVEPVTGYMWAYFASKRAAFPFSQATRLDETLMRKSGVLVSTLNPMATNTGLPTGRNPIFLQPVDAEGNAVGDPLFQAFLKLVR